MPAPRVSIVLPTLEGRVHLQRLLPALERQDFEGGFEIRAIDSSSTDGTREALEAAGAAVDVIRREDFGHGATRNRAAEGARGELLVFLTQDAEPVGPDFLSRLAEPFDDARVAGAYGRVLPRPDDDPLTRRTVLEASEASDRPQVRDLDRIGDLSRLSPPEQAAFLRFNNVASAIRASVFRQIPFPGVSFGEDFTWAGHALEAGHRIAFAPRAAVWHAHRYSPREAFRRYRVDAAFHLREFGWSLRPDLQSALRGLVYELREDWRFLRRHPEDGLLGPLLRAPWLRGAQVLGQYLGSRRPRGGEGTLRSGGEAR